MSPAGSIVLVHGIRTDVPVTPDAPTARRWALQELARPEYHEQKSLLTRLLEWIRDQFDRVGTTGGLSGTTSALIVVVAVALVLVVAFWVAGPVRRTRRVTASGALRAGDDARTADQLRAAADEAARVGDFSLSVLERFRALVRGLEERLVIDERAARTADEAGVDAGRRLPGLADGVLAAARLFDDVAYGGRVATTEDAIRLRDLEDQVRRTHAARGAVEAGASDIVQAPR